MSEVKFNVAYTTDLLIFGIDSRKNANTRSLPKKYFSILLVKRNKEPYMNKWCLPGGFIDNDETSLIASSRVLKKETGLTDVYMQQLKVNDSLDRDPRGRVISVSYMALIDRTLLKDTLNEEASWFDIDVIEGNGTYIVNLSNGEDIISYEVKRNDIDIKSEEYSYEIERKSELAFDHDKLIIEGIMALRDKVNKTDIVFNLMPQEFTIGELKQVYELLLNKKLINSAFRRTIADKVILTDKMIKTGGHRPSILCRYNEERNK
ncbi:MAG TPA: ADP-ribose pyrophosphatase [Firmicutes bacterium]|nr:ADP-ribose pyrophosphatase [Bacillota bacterium]